MRDAFGFSADAIDEVTACAFSRAAYTALVDAKPHLLKRLHEFATHELTLAHEQMMLLGRRTAEEKLICFLLDMQQRWARPRQALGDRAAADERGRTSPISSA